MKGIAIVIGLNIIALFGIFFFFKRRIDRSLRTEEVVRTIREEIEQLIIELNQTTDRNVAIIESRIDQLKEAVVSADKQIKVLNREVEKKTKESDTYLRIKPSPASVRRMRETEEENVSTRDRVLSMYRRGDETEVISKELGITLAEVELIISLSSRRG